MIDSPDTLFDLTEYRLIAGFIVALLLLRRTRGSAVLGMKLRSLRDADWLASRLYRQGYGDVSVKAHGERALLKIHKSP
ncbi:MAG: hypothetical protein P8164_04390 [Gammaproteobacteria bacterium]|jgi:hypothetical protein